MKNMFTRPEECFSRQEATSVFREKGHQGTIDIGFVTTAEGEYIVWSCHMQGQDDFLPFLKEMAEEKLPKIENFTPFKTEAVFMSGDKFYYIDEDRELQRIDTFFEASFAIAAYETTTGIEVKTIAFGLAYFEDDEEPMCCWIMNTNKILPMFKKDFPRLKKGRYSINFFGIDDIFEYNRMFWRVEEGEKGPQISPLCVESPKNKNKWINIS